MKVLVDLAALPEVFSKVVDAKLLLSQGIARNSTDACKRVGLSRSAYYKYKDYVSFPEQTEEETGVTFYLVLTDRIGVLSGVLSALFESGANVLTVNQNIPTDQTAVVTVSVRIRPDVMDADKLTEQISSLDGVIEMKKIS